MAHKNTYTVLAAAILALGGYIVWSQQSVDVAANAQTSGAQKPLVNVSVPALTGPAKIGETAFNAKCAACHGTNAAGNDGAGPPLIHKIYEPSHHGDGAFLVAPQNGVRAHHWPFGDMPPVKGVTQGDVKNIIAYVRALQRQNGIN